MPNEDLQPQTATESVSIERFSRVGGDAPLSPKMGGPTIPDVEPGPSEPAPPVDGMVITPGVS